MSDEDHLNISLLWWDELICFLAFTLLFVYIQSFNQNLSYKTVSEPDEMFLVPGGNGMETVLQKGDESVNLSLWIKGSSLIVYPLAR